MRCRFRRFIHFLFLSFSFIILYQIFIPSPKSYEFQSPFKIIQNKNQTYRILSSSFNYNSRESYLNFAYFNVEQRNRVLCIDSRYDVPVSSQWQSSGHLYPIQIAQFGLSHWSRLELNLTNKQNAIHKIDQIKPNKNGSCSSFYPINNEILLSNTFIHFTISSNSSLHFLFFRNNIELIYSTIDNLKIPTKIIVPLKNFPRQVNRHMLIDIEKITKSSLSVKSDFIKIQLCGDHHSIINQLIIGNETLYNQQAFYSATQWLLNTQDFQTGCWFIHIKRTYGKYHLRMPWCSAMAQGQSASLLIRLYSLTNNLQHLSATHRALQPLYLSNSSRAYFHNRFLWLEEYPLETTGKGLFVLNGCLYALIGIIDVYTIDPQPYLSKLIDEMIYSLYHMLPFYIHPTISNWSLYDLSHVSLNSTLNPASYSYHLVHITLLQCLSQIFRKTNISTSEFFHLYAQRFISAIL